MSSNIVNKSKSQFDGILESRLRKSPQWSKFPLDFPSPCLPMTMTSKLIELKVLSCNYGQFPKVCCSCRVGETSRKT